MISLVIWVFSLLFEGCVERKIRKSSFTILNLAVNSLNSKKNGLQRQYLTKKMLKKNGFCGNLV
ncbi:MAG: hypothetical protein DRO88_00850 [Promethearchaeia archaeon]|nr:MAG: hypothetical protein DRO88_00850 [Candidatus Lokiarchaeia archaeon]